MSLKLRKNKKMKKKLTFNEELYSASTNDKNFEFNTISTIEKERFSKNKNVNFGTIEIVEVESYKRYNQIRILTFESIENTCLKAYDSCRCILFWFSINKNVGCVLFNLCISQFFIYK